MKPIWTAALVFGVLSGPAMAAEPWCEAFAARLRSLPAIKTGQKGVVQTLEERPDFFRHNVGADDPGYGDHAEINRLLTERYGVRLSLEKFETIRIDTIPGTSLLMVVREGGSVRCQSVRVFRSGRPATELPQPPSEIVDLCEDDRARLGTTGGKPAFLETLLETRKHEEQAWLSLVKGGGWSKACRIKARFRPIFSPQISIAVNASLQRDAFMNMVRDVVPVFYDREDAPLPHASSNPEMTPERLRQLTEAGGVETGPLPVFVPGEVRKGVFLIGQLVPVSLEGREYLLRIVRGYMSRDRESSDIGIVLYELRDGKPQAVASAYIPVARGPLASLEIEPDMPAQ